MYHNRRIAVVLATYNEASYIVQTISSLPGYVDDIIVVDDGSSDETAFLVRELNEKRIHICVHLTQCGVGEAVMSGYKMALVLKADVVVTFDGDGQMDARHIRAMIRPIVREECEYTKGNRLYKFVALRKMPFLRLVGNVLFSLLTMVASGYWNVWDSQSGYTAVDRKVLEKISFEKMCKR